MLYRTQERVWTTSAPDSLSLPLNLNASSWHLALSCCAGQVRATQPSLQVLVPVEDVCVCVRV